MLKNLFLLISFSLYFVFASSQNIPTERTIDWTIAGLKDTTTQNFTQIDVADWGLIGDSVTANDSVFNILLDSIQNKKTIINFGIGAYLFKNTIRLKSNTILKGESLNDTELILNLDSVGHGILINGLIENQTNTSITQSAFKNGNSMHVIDTSGFKIGDWIKVGKKDDMLVTSHSWALGTVGQILQIENISNNEITLSSALRLNYLLSDSVYLIKIKPIENVGIECLKINRIDETPNEQSSNIRLNYAVNCWVSGIESFKCTFSHVEARNSSNLFIGNSYLHHAHNYGGGGRAYGVMLHLTSNECLIENNIFEHLRHSMIVQAGANANVFTFNYSHDPYWSQFPNDAAGDIVLHGNYVYANLFEQNICRNIVVDNSHGPNGPYNTFFRNRAEGFGIYFTSTNSPYQNIVANEVNLDTIPYTAIGYLIQGNNQYEFGNIIYDTIQPTNTSLTTYESYAYNSKPDFVPTSQWAKIGSQSNILFHRIPTYDYFNQQKLYGDNCDYPSINPSPIPTKNYNRKKGTFLIYPNPAHQFFNLKSEEVIESIEIFNNLGQSIYKVKAPLSSKEINIELNDWKTGLYFINIQTKKDTFYQPLIIK